MNVPHATNWQGIFTGMNPGHFSVSINERSIGGSPILDALNAILEGAASVTHLLRSTLERAFSYGEATHLLSITQLSAPVYYIAAGTRQLLLLRLILPICCHRYRVSDGPLPQLTSRVVFSLVTVFVHHGRHRAKRGCGADSKS